MTFFLEKCVLHQLSYDALPNTKRITEGLIVMLLK